MRVFVLLERRLDPVRWAADFESGLVPDRSPYGYHHAESLGCAVRFSRPAQLPRLLDLASRALRRLFGADVVHALANSKGLFGRETDIVWTHTEREHLAVLLLRKFVPRSNRKPIIAQSVWLIDNWSGMNVAKKAVYKWLLRDAEVLTYHSSSNANLCRSLNLNSRVEVVPFGISADSYPRRSVRGSIEADRPVRVFALGNDVHRDWQTLSSAVAGDPDIELRVASATFPDGLGAPNIQAGPLDQKALRLAFDWADVVVIPLHANLHASGITVLLEATQFGLPVIASDVGGLRDYFGDDAVMFVPPGDPGTLRDAIHAVRGQNLAAMVQRAQDQLQVRAFTTLGYAERHVAISRSLLKSAP